MYFWIQVWVLRLASIRSWGMVIAGSRPPAVRRQQPFSGAEVIRPRAKSNRFDHLDRYHGVVVSADVAVVAQIDLDTIGQSGGCDPLPGQALLALRECDRADVRSASCRADGQFAPPGTDFQKLGAGADSGRVQQPVDFASLRVGEIGPGRRQLANIALEYVIVSSRNSANRSLGMIIVRGDVRRACSWLDIGEPVETQRRSA